MLFAAVSQGSSIWNVLTLPCRTEAAGVRAGWWGGGLRNQSWGYVLLTCRCRAWPSTYFPGGLVWAGIGPDAARTAAGRFATRQEKSVDSTQFRPSTLPHRMFPSMPALSFYSLSSSFRCLWIGWGMVNGDGDGGRDMCRQVPCLALCQLQIPGTWVSERKNKGPLGDPMRPAPGGHCEIGVEKAFPDYKCIITLIRIILKCCIPLFSSIQTLSQCWWVRCNYVIRRQRVSLNHLFILSFIRQVFNEGLFVPGPVLAMGVRMRSWPSRCPQGTPSLPGRTVRGDRACGLLWGVTSELGKDRGQVEQMKAPHPI